VTKRAGDYRRRKERLALGQVYGLCDCGRRAQMIVGGDEICPRCDDIQRRMGGSESARGVVGFSGYRVLARRGER
jgi:hypothetical protein